MLDRSDRLSVEALAARYRARTAIVAVVGLGYVGLPFRRLQLINPEPLALGRRLNGVIFEIEMSSN